MVLNARDVEAAVLAAFLYANDNGENMDDTFLLDSTIFTSPLKRRIAEVINTETNGDKMYGYQSISMEDDIKGTLHEPEWIDIISQIASTLPCARRLYEKLVKKQKQIIVRGY